MYFRGKRGTLGNRDALTISTNEALETSSCNLLQDGIAEGMLAMSGSTALLILRVGLGSKDCLPRKIFILGLHGFI